MPIGTTYVCDYTGCGLSCDDTDILADATRQRVLMDASIAHQGADQTILVKQMGQHVFCSITHALAWAQGVTV